jgi:hypothetical protein
MKTCLLLTAPLPAVRPSYAQFDRDYIDQPYDVPESRDWADESEDDDDFLWPPTDDADWDVFIPEDGEYDDEPDLHDFGLDMEPDAWGDD